VYIRVYSDDMSTMYRSPVGDLLMWDSDISSCDAGNTSAMFYLLGLVITNLGFLSYVPLLYARLKLPILLLNPSNKKERVVLKPKTIFQGSGCPETTVVNNCASVSISIATTEFISHYRDNKYLSLSGEESTFDNGSMELRTEILQAAAASVGHSITIEWRANLAETQFLKYTPLLSNTGEWINTRNLGTIFRSLGSCLGDVTAKMLNKTNSQFKGMGMEEKMECFMSSVIAGLVHEPQNLIMDALRARFKDQGFSNKDFYDHAPIGNRGGYLIPVGSLIDRYGGTEGEYTDLANQITSFKYGTVYSSPIIKSFYEVDYGL